MCCDIALILFSSVQFYHFGNRLFLLSLWLCAARPHKAKSTVRAEVTTDKLSYVNQFKVEAGFSFLNVRTARIPRTRQENEVKVGSDAPVSIF